MVCPATRSERHEPAQTKPIATGELGLERGESRQCGFCSSSSQETSSASTSSQEARPGCSGRRCVRRVNPTACAAEQQAQVLNMQQFVSTGTVVLLVGLKVIDSVRA